MSPTSYQLLYPAIIIFLKKEDGRFELPHALTRLTVFKTVPFSRTWVILHYKHMTPTGFEPVIPP